MGPSHSKRDVLRNTTFDRHRTTSGFQRVLLSSIHGGGSNGTLQLLRPLGRTNPPLEKSVLQAGSAFIPSVGVVDRSRQIFLLYVTTMLICGVAAAQTVTTYHGGTYARTGLAMTVALTGQNSTDQLVVTLNGTQVFQQSGPLAASNIVNFSFGGRAAGSYTMKTSLETSGGTVRASASESITISATGSVTIDAWNNLNVNGAPVFPLTLWEDDTYVFGSYRTNGQLSGWGWIDTCYGGSGCPTYNGGTADYSASEYAYNLTNGSTPYGGSEPAYFPDSPQGAIGPGGRNGNGTGTPALNWNGGYNSGIATTYVGNSTISNDTLMWYWADEVDLNLPAPTQSTTCPGTSNYGCGQMMSLLAEVHANDPNHRPMITDFYGYSPNYFTLGRGYTLPNIVVDAISFDLYPYIQQHKRSNNGVCTTAVGNDWGACVVTINQWTQMLDYFNNTLFYSSLPMIPIIEGGGEADGTSSLCPGPNSCPSLNGSQWAMEAYLGLIHNARGYGLWTSWASGNAAPPASVLTAEKSFLSNIQSFLGAVIAQPSTRTVTTNQTTPGTWVEAMTRDYNGSTYVLGQRLTDDINNPAEATFPALNTQFTVSGLTGTQTVTVMGESRTLSATNGVFTDSFAPYSQHIYQIPTSSGGPNPPTGLTAVVQ